MTREEKIEIIRKTIEEKTYLNTRYFDNCYAYAIKSTFHDNDDYDYIYNLGNMSHVYYPPQNLEEAKEALILDMEKLGIECIECSLNDDVNENEWKVALFYDDYFNDSYDFHLLRQNEDGSWSHKRAIHGKIDDYGNIDPRILDFDLDFVGFFKLSFKQKRR